MGDEIFKQVNGWDLAKKMKGNCKIYVEHFSGAKTDCMIDSSKPSLRDDSGHFILHIGTNDFKLHKTLECIAESLIDFAVSLKNEKRDVSISNVIVRTDNQHLNKKETEVSKHLLKFCKEMNHSLIDTSKRIKLQHLNKSKEHLNKNGFKILSDIYYKAISKIFN